MATWKAIAKATGYDLYYTSGSWYADLPETENIKRCTEWPQPLDLVIKWLLQPGQAGSWDIIDVDGIQWVVQDASVC